MAPLLCTTALLHEILNTTKNMCVYLEMASEGLQATTDLHYLRKYLRGRNMKYIDDNFMKGRLDKLREKLRKSSDGISASSPSEKALMSESKDVRMLIEQCEKYNAQVELLVHSRIYELEARAIALSKNSFFGWP